MFSISTYVILFKAYSSWAFETDINFKRIIYSAWTLNEHIVIYHFVLHSWLLLYYTWHINPEFIRALPSKHVAPEELLGICGCWLRVQALKLGLIDIAFRPNVEQQFGQFLNHFVNYFQRFQSLLRVKNPSQWKQFISDRSIVWACSAGHGKRSDGHSRSPQRPPPLPLNPSLYHIEQNSKLMKKTSFKVPVVLSTLVLLELCDKSRWRCLEKQTDFASRGLYGKTIKISKLKFLFVSRDMNSEFQTLLITATALLCHVQRIYPIGAGGDAWLDYYQPNFTSVCFVLGVSLLLSSKELWPSALRRPSQPVLFCYLVRRKQQSQLKMGQRPQSPPDRPSQFCYFLRRHWFLHSPWASL